jgi:hypothetical protein
MLFGTLKRGRGMGRGKWEGGEEGRRGKARF